MAFKNGSVQNKSYNSDRDENDAWRVSRRSDGERVRKGQFDRGVCNITEERLCNVQSKKKKGKKCIKKHGYIVLKKLSQNKQKKTEALEFGREGSGPKITLWPSL